jgi:hypothetical protein
MFYLVALIRIRHAGMVNTENNRALTHGAKTADLHRADRHLSRPRTICVCNKRSSTAVDQCGRDCLFTLASCWICSRRDSLLYIKDPLLITALQVDQVYM